MASQALPLTFGEALGAAIQRRRLTLDAIRAELARRGHRVSLGTLSYWRSGQREPGRQASLEVVDELEQILDLSPGALTQLLAGRAARRARRVEPYDHVIAYSVIAPVLGASLTSERDYTRVSTHATLDMGPQHEIVRTVVRRMVAANRDGVDSMTVFTSADEHGDVSGNVFKAVAGCTITDVREVASNVRSVQLKSPRPLAYGESWMTEVEVTQDPEAGLDIDTAFELAAVQRLEEASIWVRFDPQVLPARCWMYFSEGGFAHQWEVDMERAQDAHHRQRDFGPGVIGIRWEW